VRSARRILALNPEREKPRSRADRMRENRSKIDLTETEYEWGKIYLAEYRGSCEKENERFSTKCQGFFEQLSKE
jgi:hypothetical protein